MALYGYARVSSTDQDLSLQEAALRVAGCPVVRAEKKTGTSWHGRAELDILLQFLRPGDLLSSFALTGWRAPLRTCRTSSTN